MEPVVTFMKKNKQLIGPRVSVIIPTYNRAADLKRCLDSLTYQTYKDFEVLVCDDGSTDNSEQVIKAFSDQLNITYFWRENFGGPARPRNLGLQYATGNFSCQKKYVGGHLLLNWRRV